MSHGDSGRQAARPASLAEVGTRSNVAVVATGSRSGTEAAGGTSPIAGARASRCNHHASAIATTARTTTPNGLPAV